MITYSHFKVALKIIRGRGLNLRSFEAVNCRFLKKVQFTQKLHWRMKMKDWVTNIIMLWPRPRTMYLPIIEMHLHKCRPTTLSNFNKVVMDGKLEEEKNSLGIAQITPPPPLHAVWVSFSRLKKSPNLGNAQKKGCFFSLTQGLTRVHYDWTWVR